MNLPPSFAQPSPFGLLAWLEQTRIALPLKGVECRFEIDGTIASVELDQIYHQNSDRALDCTYVFPLPAGAAVYRCELHANGRVIRARVEDRENARRLYQRERAAGHRAALVEMERGNLFTLSLGNVQPGDVLVVRLAWFQLLDRNGGALRLLIPTCPGVRYIPGQPLLRGASGRGTAGDTDQVPDASRISPPRIDALHPDAAYFSIAGRLSAVEVEPGSVSSPTHPVLLREIGDRTTVGLFGRDAVPDRDFVLSWQERKAAHLSSQAWHWTERGETYALVQLRAPDGANAPEDFSQDFYFLVDRSSSMAGVKWERTCDALQAFAGLLGPQDRVWITLFESGFRDFAETPLPAPRVLADLGFRRMKSLGTGGGTELLPAANHVLAQITAHSPGRRATVVLITDGEVGNDQDILHAFRPATDVTVHAFGIDTTVNDAFLKSLARQQRGGCWLQTPDDDIVGTIVALGDRLRRPVLTDLSVRGGWTPAISRWPNLHARELVTVVLRGDAASPLEISGRLPDGTDCVVAVQRGAAGSGAIKLLWATERISTLLESGRREEALDLARANNVICAGAAFIAWDEVERVQVAQIEVVQPALDVAARMTLSAHYSYPQFSLADQSSDFDGNLDPAGDDSQGRGVPRTAGTAVRPSRSAGEIKLVEQQMNALQPILRQEQMPESVLAAFTAWALGESTVQELNMLEQALSLIAGLREEAELPALRAALESGLRRAWSGPPHLLPQWAEGARRASLRTMQWRARIGEQERAEPVVDSLVAWMLETGTFDPKREATIQRFIDSLERLPFSASSHSRHWRDFVAATFPENSPVASAVGSWIAELESTGVTA